MNHVAVGIITRTNNERKAEYLLVSSERKHFGEHSGAYYPPGGHMDANESEQDALARELKEELCLDIEAIEKLAQTPGDIPNQTTHWWSCKIVGGKLSVDKTELADANFFTREEMAELKLWPATQKFFQEYVFNKENP